LQHDSPDALNTPHGRVKDWKFGECEPIPGRTMPKLVEVERDYTAIYDQYTTIGPLLESQGMNARGIRYDVDHHVERLRRLNGVATKGAGKGQPRLDTDRRAADYTPGLSGPTTAATATEGPKKLQHGKGQPRLDTARRAADCILGLSGTTNGVMATEGFKKLEQRTGQKLADLSGEHEGKQVSFEDAKAAPVPVITSPEWSGSEAGGRR